MLQDTVQMKYLLLCRLGECYGDYLREVLEEIVGKRFCECSKIYYLLVPVFLESYGSEFMVISFVTLTYISCLAPICPQ